MHDVKYYIRINKSKLHQIIIIIMFRLLQKVAEWDFLSRCTFHSITSLKLLELLLNF